MNAGDVLCGSFCTSSAEDAAGTLNLDNKLCMVLVKRCKELSTFLLHHQKLYPNYVLLLREHLVAKGDGTSTWSDSAACCSSPHTSSCSWEMEVQKSGRLLISNKLLRAKSPKLHLLQIS